MRLQDSFAEAQAELDARSANCSTRCPIPPGRARRDGRAELAQRGFRARAWGRRTASSLEALRGIVRPARRSRSAEESRAAAGPVEARASTRRSPASAARSRRSKSPVLSGGSAGLAIDLSERRSAAGGEGPAQNGAYKSLLDRLATAVAIFDRSKRLDFL